MIDIKDNKMHMPQPHDFTQSHDLPKKKIILKLIVVLAVIFVIWQISRSWGWLPSSNFPSVSDSDWQTVFLTNNQVYFGHLSDYNRGYVVLKDIFYLRATEPLQQGATLPGPALSLVKLGGELHGPQDTMYIPKDKVMFWENMKKDSQVVQVITSFISQQKK